jgi:hypothetical protein
VVFPLRETLPLHETLTIRYAINEFRNRIAAAFPLGEADVRQS